MKVLFVAYPNSSNSFIDRYCNALSSYCDVTCSAEEFWAQKGNEYQVIHLHWPEALIKTKEPQREEIDLAQKQLAYWKQSGAKVVVTRHNILPHKYLNEGEHLYSITNAAADVVLHFAQYSIDEYRQRYKNDDFLSKQQHVIIPHGNYIDSHQYTKEQSRKILSINSKAFVITAFGDIRKESEKQLIQQSFTKLKIKNKYLVVPRWGFGAKPPLKRRPLARLNWEAKTRYYSSELTNRRLGYKLVPETDVMHYLNATDVLLIPRTDNILNSGNVYLGFSYGKIVVGPNTGNVGEILTETGNPKFNSSDIDTVIRSLNEAYEKKSKGLEEANYNYASNNCSWDKIAQLTMEQYGYPVKVDSMNTKPTISI